MWSNFFMQQEEEGRMGVASAGGAGGMGGRGGKRARPVRMSESQEGKIKLAFFVAIVGVVLTVLGVGTEFWVELSQPKHFQNTQTCKMVHYGLWKSCIRTLWVMDIDPERESCGPAELPGGPPQDPHRTPTEQSFISGHRTLPTGRCPQDPALGHSHTAQTRDAAHGTTAPQDTAPKDAAQRTLQTRDYATAHRTLPTRTLPTGCCNTDGKPAHRTLGPSGRGPQDTSHRTLPPGRCRRDAAPQDTAHRTLPTGRCPQDAAHRTLPTGRCPQDTDHRTLTHRTRLPRGLLPHRTLPTGHFPQDAAHGKLPTGHCPSGRCPQDTSHRMLPTGRQCAGQSWCWTVLVLDSPGAGQLSTLRGLGKSNCTYFKFYTTGEPAVIFETRKRQIKT
ncbi:hypothetical protein NFI96_022005 [Prochilodus magdalenae]|nr:hypothetical protein NFI96_022005 [Prochilodus magdalenae]